MNQLADHDPWGCRRRLTDALSVPSLKVFVAEGVPDQDACRAAFQVAVELGECSAFGVDLGEADGVLPEPVAIAASEFLRTRISEWVLSFEQLADVIEDSADRLIVDEYMIDLIDALMMTHAASLAIGDTLDDLQEQGGWSDVLHEETNALDISLQQLDGAIDDCIHDLARVSRSQAVRNYRTMLAGANNEYSPWWLGVMQELEELADRQIDEEQTAARTPERVDDSVTKVAAAGASAPSARSIQAFSSMNASKPDDAVSPDGGGRTWREKWSSPEHVGNFSASLASRGGQEGHMLRFYCGGSPTSELKTKRVCLAGEAVGEISEAGTVSIATSVLEQIAKRVGSAPLELSVNEQSWESK